MDTVITCPLGSECETIRDNKIHRCGWYIELRGEDPQTGDNLDQRRCALAWMPLLLVEVSGTNRGQTEALESFRDLTIRAQVATVRAIDAATQARPGVKEIEQE